MITLLLGLGNEIYGDDGVGLHVVRRLEAEVETQTALPRAFREVDMEECSQFGLALLDTIVGYDRLVIVDPVQKKSPHSRKMHLLREKDIRSIPGPSPHYVSVPQMIEIGKEIGLDMPSETRIVAIEAKNIHRMGEGLSAEMSAKLPAIIRKVKAVLRGD